MMACVLTRHAAARCRQRGIPDGAIDVVVRHGEETDRGFFLSRKAAARRREELQHELTLLERAEGLFVAADDAVAITAYKSRSRRDRGHRHGEK
jgi:hypothetical protein